MMNNSSQWLSNGDCSKCRRKNYCSRQCSASKKFMMKEIINQTTLKKRIETINEINTMLKGCE